MDDNEILKRHLAALFYTFKDKPLMLAQYFLKYDSLKEEFMRRIIDSKNLEKAAEQMDNDKEVEKPYFNNLEEMQNYYNSFFSKKGKEKEKKVHPILGASTEEEALKKQLDEALQKEDYEKAAKIRDYMTKLGYKI